MDVRRGLQSGDGDHNVRQTEGLSGGASGAMTSRTTMSSGSTRPPRRGRPDSASGRSTPSSSTTTPTASTTSTGVTTSRASACCAPPGAGKPVLRTELAERRTSWIDPAHRIRPEYTARREDLRRAEIELMRHRERVASLRGSCLRQRRSTTTSSTRGLQLLQDGDAPVSTVRLSPSCSPHRSGRWSSTTSCTARRRPRPARCARCGSTVSTASPTTSRRTSTSPSRRRLASTPLRAARPRPRVGPAAVTQLRGQRLQIRPRQRRR